MYLSNHISHFLTIFVMLFESLPNTGCLLTLQFPTLHHSPIHFTSKLRIISSYISQSTLSTSQSTPSTSLINVLSEDAIWLFLLLYYYLTRLIILWSTMRLWYLFRFWNIHSAPSYCIFSFPYSPTLPKYTTFYHLICHVKPLKDISTTIMASNLEIDVPTNPTLIMVSSIDTSVPIHPT